MIGYLLSLVVALLQLHFSTDDNSYPLQATPVESRVTTDGVTTDGVTTDGVLIDQSSVSSEPSLQDALRVSTPRGTDPPANAENGAPTVDLSEVDAAFDAANPESTPVDAPDQIDALSVRKDHSASNANDPDVTASSFDEAATSAGSIKIGSVTVPEWAYYTLLAIPVIGICVLLLRRDNTRAGRVFDGNPADSDESTGDLSSRSEIARGKTLAQQGLSISDLRRLRMEQESKPIDGSGSVKHIESESSALSNSDSTNGSRNHEHNSKNLHPSSRTSTKPNLPQRKEQEIKSLRFQVESLRRQLNDDNAEGTIERLQEELETQSRKAELLSAERDEAIARLEELQATLETELLSRDDQIINLKQTIARLESESFAPKPR